MQCLEHTWIDIANIPAFKDRAIPCLAADHAFIDEPRVKLSAIGIEPDLIAGLERPQASTSAAYYPRLGGCFGRNGPTDLKCFAHTVLVFRSEVHQDGCVRKS